MRSTILDKIQNNVLLLNEERPRPTTKEHQLSFGIMKSSDDLPEPPNKEQMKHNHKDVISLTKEKNI